jgi:hypothetical protein
LPFNHHLQGNHADFEARLGSFKRRIGDFGITAAEDG